MESKYLNRFKRVDRTDFPLRGNRILVEVLPKEELKSAGGLIMNSVSSDHRTSTNENRADLAIVLACGDGYIDDDGTEVPMDLQPGNVILVSRMGLRLYSDFPGLQEYTKETIALSRDTEVHCAWPSIDAYVAYRSKLNS